MAIDDVSTCVNADPRLAALRGFRILDTPSERSFDDIVEAASAFCEVPIALVSLVDADRQWFKACLGLNVRETPVDQAVCAIAIKQAEPLVIPDLALDPRTAANLLVTHDPRIRFYAGAQLVTASGHSLGTLCVIDTVPRPDGLRPAQLRGLVALARQVTVLIEMRTAVEERDAAIVESWETEQAAISRVVRAAAAQEAGRVGTFELDVETDVASVSPELCRLFGLPVAPTYPSSTLQDLIIADPQVALSTARERVDGSAALDVEYRVRRHGDGEVRWLWRRARFETTGGRVARMVGTIHDITERKLISQRTSALLELGDALREADSTADISRISAEILRRELGADRVGYATIDEGNGTFMIEKDSVSGQLDSIVGTHPVSMFSRTLISLKASQSMAVANVPSAHWLDPDVENYRALGVAALLNVPLVVKGMILAVLFVHHAQPRVWSDTEIEFAHGVADRAYSAIAEIRALDQRDILNRELSHRMKNMMAMIQAIANQTLKKVTERDAVDTFNKRLMALSSAHDVLLQDSWSSALITVVIRGVLSGLGLTDRVSVEGPAITFGPRATLSLSLLLHELATNALKYGSLSVLAGHVLVEWTVEGSGRNANLTLRWTERGGPPPAAPSAKGFGSRLIGMGLSGTGGATIRYSEPGLEAEFKTSLERANAE